MTRPRADRFVPLLTRTLLRLLAIAGLFALLPSIADARLSARARKPHCEGGVRAVRVDASTWMCAPGR
jgi:hypothetical protein